MFEAEAGEILAAFRSGRLPAGVALMRLVMASRSPEDVSRRLADETGELAGLWRDHPDFWALAKALQATVDHSETAQGSPETRARALSAAFDRAAALSPDAASALYGLGDRRVLEEATAEVVDWLAREAYLRPRATILDIGCGSGRFAAALAHRATRILGLEASEGMANAARRRCAGLAGVEIALCDGGAPPLLPTASFDLALAVDAFPYIVQAGGDGAARWFGAVASALAPGGQFVILNFSYRGDFAADVGEAAALGRGCGLRPLPADPSPFQRWDGAAFGFAKT